MRELLGRCVLVICIAGSALLSAGCTRDDAWPALDRAIRLQYPEVRQLQADSLAAWLASEKPPLLLDTRTADEFEVSHLPGAIRFDPDSAAIPALDTLRRDAPIVTYCSVGYRSSDVADRLREAGFTDVMNLEGSIFRWANDGRPVYRDGRVVHEVHPYDAVWGKMLKPAIRTTRAAPASSSP